jgi:predicted nucleic acid-binding Zn ribbon protein
MPTYNYECTCGRAPWEAINKIADRHNEVCECGAKATLVLVSPQLATFSMKSSDEQKAELKRRSYEHTKKELKSHGVPKFDRKTKSYR